MYVLRPLRDQPVRVKPRTGFCYKHTHIMSNEHILVCASAWHRQNVFDSQNELPWHTMYVLSPGSLISEHRTNMVR